ncbi:hypothetical protein C8351_05650 [Salmonella enterica]|nr:hypothetical protein [Salmonella enterica]EBE9055629.1 hypothetical protein [Salmonella enterica]EBG1930977.1 hypothetical protein [Salmonella enterica]QEC91868.1 hypothetical protein C8351_05650 [Salmonella enterica]
MSAPLINTHPDAFRLKQSNRSFFWRFDGSTLYLLRTALNDPNGGWDAARPLYVNADSGQVFLGPNTKVNGNLYLGDALVHTDGNIYGTLWGGYLNNWLNNQFSARDNNINARATVDWVRQNFLSGFRLGGVESAQVWRAYGYNDTPPYVITGVINGNTDDLIDNITRRPLQMYINGWRNVDWL